MIRVAALLPAATDIVVALGGLRQLVAVTHACGAAVPRQVPRVTRLRIGGGTPSGTNREVSQAVASGAALYDIDERSLAAARPDVILTQATCDVCAVRESDVAAIAERMVPRPRVITLAAATVDGVLEDIRAVGAAIGMPDEAEELVDGLRMRLRTVHQRLKRERAPRPRVAVLEWTDPVFTAGHWVPDMVRRAGGAEVMGEAGARSVVTTPGAVESARPEIIIVAPCGVQIDEVVDEVTALRSRPEWAWTAGIAWWALDANGLTSSPGPGVVRGVDVLARVLHPTLFGTARPADARQA